MTSIVLPNRRFLPGSRDRLPRLGALGWASAVYLVVLVLVAIAAPLLAPKDPLAVDVLNSYAPASPDHWLGTDKSGRDILSRVIVGSRTSLLGPLGVVVVSTILGAALAIVSAWIGGKFDHAVARVVDALFAFPGILLAILAVAAFGRGLGAPVAALAIAYIPYIARVTRSSAVRERSLPYVQAMQALGMSSWRICLRHLLPNLAPIIAVQATIAFGYAMLDLAAMSYLGLGVQAPTPDWGLMVADGQAAILEGHPAEALYPGIAIALTVLAFNILGSRVGDAYTGRR